MKRLLIYLSLLLVAACQHNQHITINKDYHSIAQDSRIQYIVLHYTASDLQHALYLLTKGQVSSHYLIEDKQGQIYQLVDDHNRAWHAGISNWQGRTFLNSSSIGIEIVNNGFTDTAQGRIWHPYSEQQIKALIVLLKDLKARHKLAVENIIGHSDIAPQRKTDPGPLFPWRRLAKEGLAVWPNEQAVATQTVVFDKLGMPSTLWIQQHLATIGYQTPQTGTLDDQTIKVIAAFQMRFQPDYCIGIPNTRTAALLSVVASKNFTIPK